MVRTMRRANQRKARKAELARMRRAGYRIKSRYNRSRGRH